MESFAWRVFKVCFLLRGRWEKWQGWDIAFFTHVYFYCHHTHPPFFQNIMFITTFKKKQLLARKVAAEDRVFDLEVRLDDVLSPMNWKELINILLTQTLKFLPISYAQESWQTFIIQLNLLELKILDWHYLIIYLRCKSNLGLHTSYIVASYQWATSSILGVLSCQPFVTYHVRQQAIRVHCCLETHLLSH